MTTFEEMGTFEYATRNDADGDGLPRIWWHNGDKKTKTPGDFYTRAEYWVGELPEPWRPADRFDNEAGFSAGVLKILPITYRSQAFLRTEQGGKVRREYLPKWQPGASLHTEILCLAEGVEGPVVWSAKGMTGAAITGRKGGIFAQARQLLIGPAEKALKKKVPMHAFWLPIGVKLKDGKTDYVMLEQGSVITPPALRLPALEGRDLLNALYTGKALIEEAGALREQYEDWRRELRANQDADAAPVAAGRNAPQEYDPGEFGAPDVDDVI